MLITIYTNDQFIRFFDEKELCDHGVYNSTGRLVVTNTLSGETKAVECTTEQAARIIFLNLDLDAGNEEMYTVIDSVLDQLPVDLCPVP